MSRGDFDVVDPKLSGSTPAAKYKTKAGNTAIKAGEWVVRGTAGDIEYVVLAANGSSNTSSYIGVAASNDTNTASLDGEIFVFDNPDYLFRGRPSTAGNLATSILNNQVTLDVSGAGLMTIDEDDTTNGTFIIRGFDTSAGTIDVQMAAADHISQG